MPPTRSRPVRRASPPASKPLRTQTDKRTGPSLRLAGRIKSYDVWGSLSTGGMGEVWLAQHAELAVPVVLKTVYVQDAESVADHYARLLSEARLAARLTSSHVVRVLDVGVHERPDGNTAVPFLVEEYVDGIDLDELLRRRLEASHRPFPLWLVASYMAQASEALHAAHQNGVVHRDVKPSNLFGHGAGQVKLGDFGVAVASDAPVTSFAGTPLYVAPEQVADGRVDRRADVFSLGATAFTLRYGLAPFKTPQQLLQSGKSARFPPARSPDEAYFQLVVRRMIERRPDDRYGTIAEPGQQFARLVRATRPELLSTRDGHGTFMAGTTRIQFEVGELADIETDALVSSADPSMRMRDGIADALRRRAGDAVEEEALRSGPKALGECLVTSAGQLRARGLIHAVSAWNEISCISRAVHRALLLAEAHGWQRLALPALGVDPGTVALEACIDAMVVTLRFHLSTGASRLREVRFVLVDEESRRRAVDVATAVLVGPEEVDTASIASPSQDSDATFAPRKSSGSPEIRW